MPYYSKSEDWLAQSALLLEARPETTIITTRYHISPAHRITKAEKADPSAPPSARASKPPRGHLVIKTYDPVSGVALKYKTSKAAEVGRLVQMLGGLGRRQAALPPREEGTGLGEGAGEAMVVEEESGTQTPVAGGPGAEKGAASTQQGVGGGQGGAGKGKKKKGKR